MIIKLDSIPERPERVQEFVSECETFLFAKSEFHLTIAPWGVEIPEVNPDKARESIEFSEEFYFLKKHYKKNPPYVNADHVRVSVIWGIKNPYLEDLYQKHCLEHLRYLHVTTHVGVVTERGCDSWKHGIAVKFLDDIGLISKQI